MSRFSYYRVAPQRFEERWGLAFEDFAVGQRYHHRPGVTLSQQDNVDESLDLMNGAMLHFDAHYAAKTVWKCPLMVSTVTLQRLIGMGSKTFGRKRALLGLDEIALTGPVFGGDTLYAESEILALEPSPDEGVGVLHVRTRGLNEKGDQVARLVYRQEIWRRGRAPFEPEGPPEEDPRFALHRPLDDGALIEQVGLFFEECQPGETFVHWPRRSFTRDEAVEHARRSLDLSPQFHDLEWIAREQQGRYRIPETFVISAATTPSTRTFGRVVANLGWTGIELPYAVYEGDTIQSESTILDKRESKSRPNEGILGVETRACNQRGELVLRYQRRLLVYKRHAETPYASAGY